MSIFNNKRKLRKPSTDGDALNINTAIISRLISQPDRERPECVMDRITQEVEYEYYHKKR